MRELRKANEILLESKKLSCAHHAPISNQHLLYEMSRTKQETVSINECGPTFRDDGAHEMDQRICRSFTVHCAKQDLQNELRECLSGNVFLNLNGFGARRLRLPLRKALKETERTGKFATTIDLANNAKLKSRGERRGRIWRADNV